MRILLINLPAEGETKDFTTPEYLLNDFTAYPPLGLISIAADIDRRHEIKVLDAAVKGMSIDDVVKRAIEFNPDILGLTVVTRRLYACYKIVNEVKKIRPDIKIILGGPHLNSFPQETMEWGMVDFVLTGFCEKTFPQFIEALDKNETFEGIPNLYYKTADGKMQSNPPDAKPVILDDFPFPDRSLINLDDYRTALDQNRMTTMYSSRGCPFRCIFCDVQEKAFHYRSAVKIVDELESIVSAGIDEVYIFDDSFSVIRQRVLDMCREILRRGLKIKWSARARVYPFDSEMAGLMKQAGCVRLHVGVESLDPEMLKYMSKNITLEQIKNFFALCHKFKIETLAYFITGFPNETKRYREQFMKELKKLNPTYAYFNILCPLSKTEYYAQLLSDGVFKEDFWDKFARKPVKDFEIPLPRSVELQKDLEAAVARWVREYYFRPRFIFEEIKRSLSSPKMLLSKAGAAFRLLFKTFKA